MKAVCWMGKHDMQVHTVPDPTIINPQDAIVRITRTAICGSDLHLFDGYIQAWNLAISWAMSSWES